MRKVKTLENEMRTKDEKETLFRLRETDDAR